jgi:antitoxin ParD1/3/4
MIIQLSEEREQIVRSLVEEGRFASEEEVIGEALRLLQERDEQAKLAELRREIAVGIEQADRGELVPFDPQATLERIRSRQASTARQS